MLADFIRLKKAQEGSRRLNKVKRRFQKVLEGSRIKGAWRVYKAQEGTKRFKKVQEGSRWLNKA